MPYSLKNTKILSKKMGIMSAISNIENKRNSFQRQTHKYCQEVNGVPTTEKPVFRIHL